MSRWLLALCLTGTLSASTVPGYRPQDLGRLDVRAQDLSSLVSMLGLRGDQYVAAHDALKRYEESMSSGAEEVRASVLALSPPGGMTEDDLESARADLLDQIREEIDQKRKKGVFDADPAAMRLYWQERVEEVERELDELRGGSAKRAGMTDATRSQGRLLAAWEIRRAELQEALLASLNEVVGPDKESVLRDWWVRVRVEGLLNRSRLAGERLEPFAVLPDPSVAEVLAQEAAAFRKAHLELLNERDRASRMIPIAACESIASNHPRTWMRAISAEMSAREAVRDHAIESLNLLAEIIPDGDVWAQSTMASSFPGVWRRDSGSRLVQAALALSSISPQQRLSLESILEAHDASMQDAAKIQQQAVIAEEAAMLIEQDRRQVRRFFPDVEIPDISTSQLDQARALRVQLETQTREEVRRVLDQSQWDSLPGTQSAPETDGQ